MPVPGLVDPWTVTSAYAIDLGLMNLILAYFCHVLTTEKSVVPREMLRNYRLQRNTSLLGTAIFFFSVLPIFSPIQRIALWVISLGTYTVRKMVEDRWARRARKPERDSHPEARESRRH